MLHTLKYKFKKRELSDSPPDITVTEGNWDIVERELDKIWRELDKTFKMGAFLPNGTHADSLWSTGYYTCYSFEGLPRGQGDKQGAIIVYNYNGNPKSFWSRQVFISPHDERMYERQSGDGQWSVWRLLPTTTKIEPSHYETKSGGSPKAKLRGVIAWLKH